MNNNEEEKNKFKFLVDSYVEEHKPKEETKKEEKKEEIKETKAIDENEELLMAYIGKNYEKIAKRPFNFAAFIFSYLYFFYRKMTDYGLLFFCLTLVLINFTNNYYGVFFFNLISGLFFNILYVHSAKKDIKNIKMNNPKKTLQGLKLVCTSKGGASVGKIFSGIFGSFILFMAIMIVCACFNITTFFSGIFSDFSTLSKNYDGVFSYNSNITILDEYDFSVPSLFSQDTLNSVYNLNYSYDACSFEFFSPEGYNNSQNLAKQMKKYFSSSDIEKLSINDITWYTLSYKTTNEDIYVYITRKNSNVYVFEYKAENNAACLSYKEEIINSITLKS